MKMRNILIAIFIALTAYFAVSNYHYDEALDACVNDVKGLFRYAVMLEEENARLNASVLRLRANNCIDD